MSFIKHVEVHISILIIRQAGSFILTVMNDPTDTSKQNKNYSLWPGMSEFKIC